MSLYTVFLLIFSGVFLLTECATQNAGVQMRLTQKGMQYVIDIGKEIIQTELMKKTLDVSGSTGSVEYELSGLQIKEIRFSNPTLSPVPKVGISAQFTGISLAADGKVWYKYRRGWIKFSDDIDLSVSIEKVSMSITLSITASANGHPVVALKHCDADVQSVDLKFHGGFKAWIYNLFSGIAEKKIKGKLNDMLCDVVQKEIDSKVQAELRTFPVVMKLDKWAKIDYRLTQSPLFTKYYMDAFFKGEFQPVQHAHDTKLIASPIKVTSDHNKMIYFWVTNYTINTAGEVYQGSNQFDIELKAWDKKIPEDIRKNLNTDLFEVAIPNLDKYSNLPMGVRLVSYRASKVELNEGDAHLFLYADATFSVRFSNGTIFEVFQIRFDIDTTLKVKVNKEKIGGEITEFKYNAKITKSNIGKILTPLDNPLIKVIVETTIVDKANPKLEKGFPLPHLDHVSFKKLDITLHKGFIRIGADIDYTKY